MRRVLPVVLLVLGFAPAAQAAPFSVGAGRNAGIRGRRRRRVIPRRGRASTLRLRVRRCGATR